MAVQQKMGAGSSVSTVVVVPGTRSTDDDDNLGNKLVRIKDRGLDERNFPVLSKSGDDGENNNCPLC